MPGTLLLENTVSFICVGPVIGRASFPTLIPVVKPGPTVGGLRILTEADISFAPGGTCMSSGTVNVPCTPKGCKWMNVSTKVKIGGVAALLSTSFCTCSSGGMIKPNPAAIPCKATAM